MWEFNLWVGKIPWRRERLPTPVFWPGESYGLHSPWGYKELNTNEWLSLSHPSPMLLVFFLSHISLFHLRYICFLCSMHIYLAEARFSQLFLFAPFASVLFSVHSYCSWNPSSLSSPSISESPVDCFLTFFFFILLDTWGSNYSTFFSRSLGCLQPLILTQSRQIPLNEFHPVSAGWDLAITGFTQSETLWSKKIITDQKVLILSYSFRNIWTKENFILLTCFK